jgi:uncharacterized protein (DUF3084 family)
MEAGGDAERSGRGNKSRGRGRQDYPATGIDDHARVLGERVESVAAREHELIEMRAQLERRLADLDKQGGRRADRQLLEREKQVAAGEERLAQLEQELQAKVAAAEEREREVAFELSLANAEREKLDERERAAKEVERELAELRERLDDERSPLSSTAPPPATPEAKSSLSGGSG